MTASTIYSFCVLGDLAGFRHGPTRWFLAAIAAVCALDVLILAAGRALPQLVDSKGAFSYLQFAWQIGLFILLIFGSYESAMRRSDVLLAGLTISQASLASSHLWSALGGNRYSVGALVAGFFLLAGYVGMAITLLSDHSALLIRETQLSRDLRGRSDELRALLESLPDLVLVQNLDGWILEANDQAAVTLGYSKSELRSLRNLDIEVPTGVPSDAAPRLPESHGDAETYVCEHRRKDGSTLPIEVRVSRREWRGQPCLIAAARDISDRKRAEAEQAGLRRELIKSQRLESIGRLAAGLAHDFNNLLTVINGNCALAVKSCANGGNGLEAIREIRSTVAVANGLTQQLLAFGRKQAVKHDPVDLNLAVEKISTLLQPVLGAGVDLHVSLAVQPAIVLADAGQMEQMLMNLILNSRDAMPRGGEIRVQLGLHEDSVRLTVSDDGLGMDEHTLEHLFEPFFTTKPPQVGTGLGLSVVHGVVAQSGGTVRVESTVGAGSEFHIDLPRHSPSIASV